MSTNPQAQGFDFNRPTIVALLILVGAVTGLPTLIGAVLAFVWRSEPGGEAWEQSHFAYHIRGFWITIVFVILGAVLALVLVGFAILGLIPVWLVIRAVVALAKAQRREPMPNPDSFLW